MINDLVKTGGLQAVTNAKVLAIKTEKPVAVAPEPESAPTDEQVAAPSNHELTKAVSKLNDYVQNISRTLSFSIAENTGRTIIRVYDSETDELIRQIPPEQTISLAENLNEFSASLFIKERA